MVHAPFFNFSSIWLSSLKPIICLHSVRLLCMVSVFPFSVYRCSDQSHSLPVRAGEAQPATGSPRRFRVCKCVSLNHLCLHTNQGQIQLFWKPCTKLFLTSAVYEIFKHDKKDLNSNWICSWVWRYNVSSNINNDKENRIIENTMNESYLRIFYVSKVKDPEHVFLVCRCYRQLQRIKGQG